MALVSDTGSSEEKFRVFPVGVEPVDLSSGYLS